MSQAPAKIAGRISCPRFIHAGFYNRAGGNESSQNGQASPRTSRKVERSGLPKPHRYHRLAQGIPARPRQSCGSIRLSAGSLRAAKRHKDRTNRRELPWRSRRLVTEQENQIVAGEQLTASRRAIDDQGPGLEEKTDIVGRLADRRDGEGDKFVRRIRYERHNIRWLQEALDELLRKILALAKKDFFG